MRKIAPVLACALLSFSFSAAAAAPTAEPGDPVVGHALTQLEIPGEVSAVMWTKRATHFTLQISRRTAGTGTRGPVAKRTAAGDPPPEKDDVQVWLLRADGTHIEPLPRSTVLPSLREMSGCGRCLGYWINYAFPLAAAEDAVAVAMQFNGRFLIEKLPAL
ncbi:MAG: hypothetical protein M3Y79_07200 [Pseudomonadota bacterium]|nr:hypothetical protein [Pseudomonadota bacterium]